MEAGWGDTNPEDDAGYFAVSAAELRGLRLSRMGWGIWALRLEDAVYGAERGYILSTR